jgi:hypothetical protein
MDGIALVFLLLCNTVDAISSLGEEFSVVWDAPYFLWISYLGLTSFNRSESRESAGAEVDLISRPPRGEFTEGHDKGRNSHKQSRSGARAG